MEEVRKELILKKEVWRKEKEMEERLLSLKKEMMAWREKEKDSGERMEMKGEGGKGRKRKREKEG